MMPEKDWPPLPLNDDWAEHDLCHGAQQGNAYPATIARRYGAIADLPDFVRKSQLANYEAFRAMYEGRFAKLFHPVTGVLTWMSNPAQPSMVWQLYSHDLEPNAALFATRKACEPLHVQLNQSDHHVMVVNAMPVARPALRVRTRVFGLDSQCVYDLEMPVNAAASAATDVGPVGWPPGLNSVHFVKLDLRDESDHVLSENFYWRTVQKVAPTTATSRAKLPHDEEDLTGLAALPPTTVDVRFTRRDLGGRCFLNATLTNAGPSVALLTHVQLCHGGSRARVLPVYYSDNYVSLLPGESRTIEIEAAVAVLQGEEPSLFLDGWNIAR
jgi:beta-mannosidase